MSTTYSEMDKLFQEEKAAKANYNFLEMMSEIKAARGEDDAD